MKRINGNFSEEFNHFYFWIISDAKRARFARARNDVPFEIVDALTAEEQEYAKNLIYEKMQQGDIKDVYVNILVHLKDRNAIPVLRQYLELLMNKNKQTAIGDFSHEINLCKNAIHFLKNL